VIKNAAAEIQEYMQSFKCSSITELAQKHLKVDFVTYYSTTVVENRVFLPQNSTTISMQPVASLLQKSMLLAITGKPLINIKGIWNQGHI